MSEPYTPNLGQFPGEKDRRDAVHVAVIPVEAGCELKPGTRVGRRADGKFVSFARPGVPVGEPEINRTLGVVDPFLDETVKAGDKFWLFLFPGSITSLRHVWTHPDFKPTPPK